MSESTASALRQILGMPEPEPEELPDWWECDEVEEAFAKGLTTEQTVILPREDGLNLLYAAKIHSFVGESESLKTWICLFAAYEEIRKGNKVLYLDYESDANHVLKRMQHFGLTEGDLKKMFVYRRPEGRISSRVLLAIGDLVTQGLTLVVIDGVNEAITAYGLKINDTEGVASFYKSYPRKISALGPAVAMIDHVTKNAEGRGVYAIGSQHKRAGIDGASYIVEKMAHLAPGKHGKAKLMLAKDRPGHVRANTDDFVGIFNAVSDPSTHEIQAYISLPTPPTSTVTGTKGGPDSDLAKKLLQSIKDKPGQSKNSHADKVNVRKRQERLDCLGWLLNNGYVLNIGTESNSKLAWVKDLETVEGLEDLM